MFVEKKIYDIERSSDEVIKRYRNAIQTYQEAIQHQNKSYSNLIYRIGRRGLDYSQIIDNNLKRILPGKYFTTSDTHEVYSNVFNPKYVIEFKDFKPHRLIKSWDQEKGILPNVMTMYNLDYNIDSGSDARVPLQEKYSSNPYLMYSYVGKNYNDRSGFDRFTLRFNVDNYMNMYNPSSGIYFMFNKIPFPQMAFSLKEKKLDFVTQPNNFIDLPSSKFENLYSAERDIFFFENFVPTNIKEVMNYFLDFRNTNQLDQELKKGFEDEIEQFYTETYKLEKDISCAMNQPKLENLFTADSLVKEIIDKIEKEFAQQEAHANSNNIDEISSSDDESIDEVLI